MTYKTLHRKIQTLQWSKDEITNNDLQNTTQKNTDIAMIKGRNNKKYTTKHYTQKYSRK
jgi:Tfp pilus assembly major pilin PilA